jgi:hypothetical protein
MKKLLPIILFCTACSTNPKKVDKAKVSKDTLLIQTSEEKDISDSTNTLNFKTETLRLNYIVWGCACANWITPSDFKKYQDDKLAEHCIFIEPANKDLELPIYFDPERHFIKVTGQFYLRPGYPKGTILSEEHLDKAKILRYTELQIEDKVLGSNLKNEKTLILYYNAIACPCPQWSALKFNNNPKDRLYYLERTSNKLIEADSLYDGIHLPVKIKVTGEVVSENGYPKGFNSTKGTEAGKVFRYKKIKVINRGK